MSETANTSRRIRRFLVGVGITAAASTLIGFSASTISHDAHSISHDPAAHATHTHHAHPVHIGGRLHHHVPDEH